MTTVAVTFEKKRPPTPQERAACREAYQRHLDAETGVLVILAPTHLDVALRVATLSGTCKQSDIEDAFGYWGTDSDGVRAWKPQSHGWASKRVRALKHATGKGFPFLNPPPEAEQTIEQCKSATDAWSDEQVREFINLCNGKRADHLPNGASKGAVKTEAEKYQEFCSWARRKGHDLQEQVARVGAANQVIDALESQCEPAQ